MNWIEAVTARLNNSDEAKLKRLQKHIIKYCEKQVSSANDKMDDNKERIEETKEQIDDMLLSVDLTQINDLDKSKEYAKTFSDNYDNKCEELVKLQEKEKDLEATKIRRQEQITAMGKEFVAPKTEK